MAVVGCMGLSLRCWQRQAVDGLGGRSGTGDGGLVVAEVGGHDHGVVEHLVGRSGGDEQTLVEGDEPIGDRGDERHVVLDDQQAGAQLVAEAQQQRGRAPRTSRWAMPLDGSSSSTTVGRWATTQARSTTRREPVDSSRTNLVRNASRCSSSMSSSTRLGDRLLGVEGGRQVQGRVERILDLDPAVEGDRDRLLDRQRREQPGVLERTAEPGPGPHVGTGPT